MTNAEKAYKAAQTAIAEAKDSGAFNLSLSAGNDEIFAHLQTLPPEITGLNDLEYLRIWGTRITTLDPIRDLTNLTDLDLSDTQINTLEQIRDLTKLTHLNLSGTQVTTLDPIRDLANLTNLSLSGIQVTTLDPIRDLTNLTHLNLSGIQVTTLDPIRDLDYLKSLYLDGLKDVRIDPVYDVDTLETLSLTRTTPDLTRLARLTSLTKLWLDGTPVTDLAPLQALTDLRFLNIASTRAADMRPLLVLENLGTERMGWNGLHFQNTPAAGSSPDLTRLSDIEDDAERTRETLAYLRTLPPYPQPLPWDAPDTKPELQPDPSVPGPAPAPLQVVEDNGVLRPAMPGDGLDENAHLLAQQGWQALRDYLADLADQRARIDNAMPRLGRAMQRLDVALGDTYAAINPVAVGTHGNRVIRLSGNAADMLMEEDADDIIEFTAAWRFFSNDSRNGANTATTR